MGHDLLTDESGWWVHAYWLLSSPYFCGGMKLYIIKTWKEKEWTSVTKEIILILREKISISPTPTINTNQWYWLIHTQAAHILNVSILGSMLNH